jgi:hypothetical protein
MATKRARMLDRSLAWSLSIFMIKRLTDSNRESFRLFDRAIMIQDVIGFNNGCQGLQFLAHTTKFKTQPT